MGIIQHDLLDPQDALADLEFELARTNEALLGSREVSSASLELLDLTSNARGNHWSLTEPALRELTDILFVRQPTRDPSPLAAFLGSSVAAPRTREEYRSAIERADAILQESLRQDEWEHTGGAALHDSALASDAERYAIRLSAQILRDLDAFSPGHQQWLSDAVFRSLRKGHTKHTLVGRLSQLQGALEAGATGIAGKTDYGVLEHASWCESDIRNTVVRLVVDSREALDASIRNDPLLRSLVEPPKPTDDLEQLVLREAVIEFLLDQIDSSARVGKDVNGVQQPLDLEQWMFGFTEGLANGLTLLLNPLQDDELRASDLARGLARAAARDVRLSLMRSTTGIYSLPSGKVSQGLVASLRTGAQGAALVGLAESEAFASELTQEEAWHPAREISPNQTAGVRADALVAWLVKSADARKAVLLDLPSVREARDGADNPDDFDAGLLKGLADYEAALGRCAAPWSSLSLALDFHSTLKRVLDRRLPNSFSRKRSLFALAKAIDDRRSTGTTETS
ncbi:MAG: hypothetical protein AAFZ65_17540, partial [Planctomycetota bacterium]